ncbi:hypothetical protein FSP39_009657 [Pinctada imbricata]|uniref:Protein DD3-3 n=1 Tax=Pinctada imbricata TaxID=66713 RepID=A0AA88YBF6_PINIB|nr:hypothetical protein FSP39_009657 [Pinctada imbricata]
MIQNNTFHILFIICRLFDSQNNNRGGYNVGSLYYYEGSVLPIEWTNQHSCASPNAHCEIILQYMCDDWLRDGATTKQAAVNTRQNPNGNRRGYECPEERDYYPYWRPSPWKDIAVMTNDVQRCEYYRTESANVKSKWACVIPMDTIKENQGRFLLPNNKEDCEAFTYPSNDPDGVRGVWTEFPAHGIPAPECRETEFSRDNHLGNGLGGQPNIYNWTVPNEIHEQCAIRIRYNISTEDYDPWNTTYNTDEQKPLATKYGFNSVQAADNRGYVFENDPQVEVFNDADFQLELAINTAQFGRTFQDRTHSFAIRPRPASTAGVTIHNLNVRGKRGNIVQVYPAVEYDFVPNHLEMAADDVLHIQWTGSNTNPPNNDGNGLARTDRNNMVLLTPKVYAEGSDQAIRQQPVFGHYGNNYPVHVENSTLLGFARADLLNLAYNSPNQLGGELSQLDDAGTYFDLGPRRVSQVGTYQYMCSRNNDFTNRDQKGRITVVPYPIVSNAIGWTGGMVTLADSQAVVMVEQGDFSSLQKLRMEEWTVDQAQSRIRSPPAGDDYASSLVILYPEEKLTVEGQSITMQLKLNSDDSDITVYRSTSNNMGSWTRIDTSVSNGMAEFQTQYGGVYVARKHSNIGPIVGIVAAVVVVALIVVATIVYFKRNPGKWTRLMSGAKKAERSVQNKV